MYVLEMQIIKIKILFLLIGSLFLTFIPSQSFANNIFIVENEVIKKSNVCDESRIEITKLFEELKDKTKNTEKNKNKEFYNYLINLSDIDFWYVVAKLFYQQLLIKDKSYEYYELYTSLYRISYWCSIIKDIEEIEKGQDLNF